MLDIMIIGAGIIGGTVAYELSKYNKNVLVIEKMEDAGLGVTTHNSAIVHSGVDPEPNTLKAKYNVLGSKMYEEYTKELDTPYYRIGAFVVARSEEDVSHLDNLEKNAKDRGVFVERLSKEEAIKLEPNLPSDIHQVLNMPTTAIINPSHLAQQAIKKAKEKGVQVHFNEKVLSIKKLDEGFEVITDQGVYQTKAIVNAAGLYTEVIEQMVSQPTFKLRLLRGDYILLSEKASSLTSRILYPVPTAKGKGVLVVPKINHMVLIGPNSIAVSDPTDDQADDAGIEEVKEKAKEIITHVPYEYEIMRVAGIRPKEIKNDFIIAENKYVPYFFSLAGIDSPGVSSAPAIAIDFVHRILKERLGL